jgi:hypothetical protein
MTKISNFFKQFSPILLGGLVLLLAFSYTDNLFSSERKIAFQTIRQITRKYEKKYGMHFSGISEVSPAGKYENLGFDLEMYRKLSKDEGRVILLELVDDTLNAFNNDPAFRQHMKTYPFTGHNIIISIVISPPSKPIVYYPDIGEFSFYNDIIRYKTNTPHNGKPNFNFTEEKETLEEARAIVEAQRQEKQ